MTVISRGDGKREGGKEAGMWRMLARAYFKNEISDIMNFRCFFFIKL